MKFDKEKRCTYRPKYDDETIVCYTLVFYGFA